jgi:hypothetical protein
LIDGTKYPRLREKTWRGAKLRKLAKYIKKMRKNLDKSNETGLIILGNIPIKDMTYYGSQVAIMKVMTYIYDLFGLEEYRGRKAALKQKQFAGIRVAMLVEFLDYQLKCIVEEVQLVELLKVDQNIKRQINNSLKAQAIIFKTIRDAIINDDFYEEEDEDEEVFQRWWK